MKYRYLLYCVKMTGVYKRWIYGHNLGEYYGEKRNTKSGTA